MITNVPCVCVPVASSADKVDVFNANVGDTVYQTQYLPQRCCVGRPAGMTKCV